MAAIIDINQDITIGMAGDTFTAGKSSHSFPFDTSEQRCVFNPLDCTYRIMAVVTLYAYTWNGRNGVKLSEKI